MREEHPRTRAVYDWELAVLLPNDSVRLPIETIRTIVPYVWAEAGLRHPPSVELCHGNRGHGSRKFVAVPRIGLQTWYVLHELAHSMDMSLERSYGEEDPGLEHDPSGHGDNWLGLYVDLLDRHMGPRFNKLYMMKTLHDRGITFAMCPIIRAR